MSRRRCYTFALAPVSVASTLFFNVVVITLITNIIKCVHSVNELCPDRCKCEDEFLRATCVFASLEVVPIQLNPEIQHLDLSNNRITSLILAFGFYDNLQSLDLSSNVIHTLGSENFLLQKHLMKLNVSNNGIRTISKSALKGLESLNYLDLSNNNISEIDPQAFRYTNNLEQVDLSRNSLMSLPHGLLENLPRIKTLKLKHNSLLRVPTSNLELAPSLQLLDLSDNLILEIDSNSIPFLRSLITFNLANNVITSISDEAFERIPALLHLNIEGNNLTLVPTNSLARLSVLSHLLISRNPLKILNSLAFRNLFELKTLDLRQCELMEINSRAFTDNINLEEILLDDNHQLQHLPSRVLYSARYLKIVSLRNCKLSTLQPTHFPVDDLKSLQLGGNPFVCNCSLHWLWNVIHTEEQRNMTRLSVDSDEIICSDSEFGGKLLTSLKDNSLRCRLSLLYLGILAFGCLVAAVTISSLVVWIKRIRRLKSSTFTQTNRPELLVYVGSTQAAPKNNSIDQQYSVDRQLIQSNNEVLYDVPYQHQRHENSVADVNHLAHIHNSRSNNFHEIPHDYYHNVNAPFISSIDNSSNLHQTMEIERKQFGTSLFTDSNPQQQMPFQLANSSNCEFDNECNYRNTIANNQTSQVVFV